jgi:hypothetical protein
MGFSRVQKPGNKLRSKMAFLDTPVLDEDVIKTAFQHVFRRALTQFESYIVHRRNSGTVEAWSEFENLTKKWIKESSTQTRRDITGGTA